MNDRTGARPRFDRQFAVNQGEPSRMPVSPRPSPVAISNHRLIAFDGERVTFQWKDYAHGNQWRTMTLTAMEFLRRFVQHVLPRGFVRIRQFGYLASACRTARLALARRILRQSSPPSETPSTPPAWHCPRCGATMVIGPILSARQLAALTLGFDTS